MIADNKVHRMSVGDFASDRTQAFPLRSFQSSAAQITQIVKLSVSWSAHSHRSWWWMISWRHHGEDQCQTGEAFLLSVSPPCESVDSNNDRAVNCTGKRLKIPILSFCLMARGRSFGTASLFKWSTELVNSVTQDATELKLRMVQRWELETKTVLVISEDTAVWQMLWTK